MLKGSHCRAFFWGPALVVLLYIRCVALFSIWISIERPSAARNPLAQYYLV